MSTLTWTSMNIDSYLNHVHQGLNKLEQLIINVNDIIENRVENNLKNISKVSLVSLPHGILAIGGYNGKNYLNNVELFDFDKEKWV